MTGQRAPRELNYNMIPPQAQKGLEMLGQDIYNYLSKKKEPEVKTETKDGKIINTINVYGNTTPSVKFGFIRTVWIVFWMVVMIAVTWTIITNPGAIINFGNWLHNLFI